MMIKAESKEKAKALDALLEQQRRWAGARHREPEYPDYVLNRDDNLLRPLSAASEADFGGGSGGEFKRRYKGKAPPKFTALRSSSALVCNIVDYWRAGGEALLGKALGSDPHQVVAVKLEAQYQNGVSSRPCNLDVALMAEDGWLLAVEGKFTESFGRKIPLKPEYLPSKPHLTPWKVEGLVNCDRLARQIQDEPGAYDYLDVPQLLKHILGLHRTRRKKFPSVTALRDKYRLLYLYYDVEGPAGAAHGREVDRFNSAVDGEIDFRSMTYQSLVSKMRTLAPSSSHSHYFDYLESRYQLGR